MKNAKNKILTVILATLLTLNAYAEEVEVTLIDKLDGNLNGYCLDIKGGGRNIDPANGLQTHTCYSYKGALGSDQVFDSTRFADNALYMPKFDVCVQLDGLESGAKVSLTSCDNSELQQISLEENGNISPVVTPDMCLTAGESTKLGRGGTSQHQIKTLTLEKCSSDKAAYQQWRARKEMDN